MKVCTKNSDQNCFFFIRDNRGPHFCTKIMGGNKTLLLAKFQLIKIKDCDVANNEHCVNILLRKFSVTIFDRI